MKSLALLVALLASACTQRNPEVCCTTQEDCDALGLPTGNDCGDGLTCIGNRCVATTTCQAPSDCPSATPQCNPEGVCVECLETSECGNQVCSAAGQCVACVMNEECPTGLCSQGTCRTSIVPKYLPTECNDVTAPDLVLANDIDTTDDTSCDAIIQQGGGAPEICVIRGRTIQIVAGAQVTVSGARALGLVAEQGLSIEGTLDASASGTTPGPGGGGSSGDAPTTTTGGGGAGFRTAGAAGGNTATPGGGNNGGAAVSDPADGTLLLGGQSSGGNGGGGGGSITLVACRGQLSVGGLIDLAGGGGRGGSSVMGTGGNGGGSGGYLALQGVSIQVTGSIFANGGGAGAGALISAGVGVSRNGEAGDDGSRSSSLAASGGAGQGGFADGGIGGLQDAAPGSGKAGVTNANGTLKPGGGGGSVGFLQLFVPPGVAPEVRTATTSPALDSARELTTK